MPYTIKGFFKELCQDCRKKKAQFQHKGNLVPKDKVALLCAACMTERESDSLNGLKPRAIGANREKRENQFLQLRESVKIGDKVVAMLTYIGSGEREKTALHITLQIAKSDYKFIFSILKEASIDSSLNEKLVGLENEMILYFTVFISLDDTKIPPQDLLSDFAKRLSKAWTDIKK